MDELLKRLDSLESEVQTLREQAEARKPKTLYRCPCSAGFVHCPDPTLCFDLARRYGCPKPEL